MAGVGLYTGMCGLGGFRTPLTGTAMVNGGIRWNLFYLLTLFRAVFVAIFTAWTHKGCDDDQKRWYNADPVRDDESVEMVGKSTESAEEARIQAALKDYRTWMIFLFIFSFTMDLMMVAGL